MALKLRLTTITVLTLILLLPGTGLGEQASIRHLASINRIEETGVFGVLGGVFFDEDRDRIYVTDASNGRILAYDSDFKFVSEFKGAEGLTAPVGIVKDSKGRFFVTQPTTGQVLIIDIGQRRIEPLDMSKAPKGNPVYPGAIAIDAEDWLYIADKSNQRIMLFDSNLEFARVLPVEGSGLNDVTVDSQGRIYALNTRDGSVCVYDKQGARISKFGSRGNGKGEFSFPVSLAVDQGGTVYVLDQHLSEVLVFNRSGRFLFDFARFGWMDGRLHYPTAIYVNKAGRIFVVDQQNARISIFE
jgi:DNA-binding beta-propeller fold protein YncE